MLITTLLPPHLLVPEQACGLVGGPLPPLFHTVWQPCLVGTGSVGNCLCLITIRFHGLSQLAAAHESSWRTRVERGMFRDTPRIGAVHFFLWEGKKPKRRKTGNYLHPGKWGLGPHLANFPALPPLLMAIEPGPMRDVGESTCCSWALGPG